MFTLFRCFRYRTKCHTLPTWSDAEPLEPLEALEA